VPSLYVHALTDTPVPRWTQHGRTFESVAIGSVFAVCERRSDPPPPTEEQLRTQHSIVVAIASQVPAVLPARFGSLVDADELAAIVSRQEAAIESAITLVRGKVQMTLRMTVPSAASRPAAAAASGRQYLELRRRQASPRVPPRLEAILAKVSQYVVQERRESTTAGSITVYHLVERTDLDRYRALLADVARIRVSGPWPPFAFVPEIWS
jgi:hypothetical protein